MKKIVSPIFYLMLFCNFLMAQKTITDYSKQEAMLEKAFKFSLKNKNIDSLDNFINSNAITDKQVYSSAYSRKACLLYKLNRKRIKTEGNESEVVREILENYKKAIESNDGCKLCYQADRLLFLKDIKDTTLLYKSDLNELKLKGFQEEFLTLNLGVNLMKGKDNWLGGSVSLLNFNSERWKRQKSNEDSTKQQLPFFPSFKFGFFNATYLINTNTRDYDLSISLLEYSAPVLLNFTKFGFQKSKETGLKYWYYRPEIGFSWKSFSIYYSYNCMLKKQLPQQSEKHLVNLRINLPVLKWKNLQ